MATLHPYQGWADKFLNTPGDGVEDIYISLIANVFGAKFVAVYHDFNSDNNNYDYGSEWNLLLTKTIKKQFTVGLKYADYHADSNPNNIGGQSSDISKLWAFVRFKYN